MLHNEGREMDKANFRRRAEDYFSTTWFGLARLCFRRRKYGRAETILLVISNQR